MKNLKKHFPLLNQYTYLNTAASGLLAEEVFEFRQEHDLDFLIGGSLFRDKRHKILDQTREVLGKLFGLPAERVALIPNFSIGFKLLLEKFDKSKKVLLLKNDYPSINDAVEGKFETCYAEIDENLEENILEAVRNSKPDIFAFSIVQYINGIKIDLDFLKDLKTEFPELLIFADGTQYFGTEKFDFDASGIDVLGASAYKWLNAGYGNGFLLFSELFLKKYKSKNGNFREDFEIGHLDTFNFGSLLHAIQFIEKIGMENIQNQINSLSEMAKIKFSEQNLLEKAIFQRKNHSSIFNIEGDDALFEYLRSKNILCARRGSGIRVSFHYFNTAEDLEILMTALEKRKIKK